MQGLSSYSQSIVFILETLEFLLKKISQINIKDIPDINRINQKKASFKIFDKPIDKI